MVRDTILCLCDLTGIMAVPWVGHGYRAVLVDPQHGVSREEGSVVKLALTVWEAMPYIGDLVRGNRVAFVAAFPPCTDMAVSGARWFDRKRRADPLFQAKAVDVAEQCRIVGKLSGAPYFVENPVSVLSGVFGHPDYTFHPFQFTRWCAADNYRKRTCLWVGNGFVMPPPQRPDMSLGDPDDRIHKCPPGKDRANFRSRTPLGFARAVFDSNAGTKR